MAFSSPGVFFSNQNYSTDDASTPTPSTSNTIDPTKYTYYDRNLERNEQRKEREHAEARGGPSPSSSSSQQNTGHDPFSRLLSSLDRPRFSKATIDGDDLLEDRHTEQKRHNDGIVTNNTNYDHVTLTRPESVSLRSTARRSKDVADRLRNELEDVRLYFLFFLNKNIGNIE